jgi:hypothetical protein
MFGKKNPTDYSQVNLDDFSDDSSNGEEDFVQKSVRNQQVRFAPIYFLILITTERLDCEILNSCEHF